MADKITKEQRSHIMRMVRSKDTGPEMLVRRAAHRLGLRFRLHRKELPGRPDLVFTRWHTAVFVHGCFWHRHPNCPKATFPKSNVEFWSDKFQKNICRDEENYLKLTKLGWRVVVIWQCEVPTIDHAEKILRLQFPSK